MLHASWPAEGCTLAQARERTADRTLWKEWRGGIEEYNSLGSAPSYAEGFDLDEIRSNHRLRTRLRGAVENRRRAIIAEFCSYLSSRQLIAYGRPGDLNSTPQLITADIWPALTQIDWEASAASERQKNGTVFRTVRVFPVLCAPCRDDLVADHTLAEAFKRFILDDPEVVALAKEAIRLAPKFKRVFSDGCCYVDGTREWPASFEGKNLTGVIHSDPKERSPIGYFSKSDPHAVATAAAALVERYGALLEMLRKGELQARGIPVEMNYSEQILRSVWSHSDFYFSASSGDLFEVNQDSEDPPRDWLTKRWMGVVLQRPPGQEKRVSGSDSFSGLRYGKAKILTNRKRPKSELVQSAIAKAGIDIVGSNMGPKAIASKIIKHLPSPPKTKEEQEALAKLIARLRDRPIENSR